MTANESTTVEDKRPESSLTSTLGGCVGVVVGVLILFLFIGYVVDAVQRPRLAIVGVAERWAYLAANVIVACYCFPAFKATKQRAFLYLAFAALSFAYGSLFTLLFGERLPSPTSRAQLLIYYGGRHFVETVGLVLYAWGVILLARRAQEKGRE